MMERDRRFSVRGIFSRPGLRFRCTAITVLRLRSALRRSAGELTMLKIMNVDAGIIQTFSGSGGLSSAQFSFSFSPAQDLYFGATTHYLFGNFDDVQQLEYDSVGYFTTNGDKNISMNGFAFTFGGVFAGIDKALGLSKEKHMNIGATIFSGATLNSTEQILSGFLDEQRNDRRHFRLDKNPARVRPRA